jgi:hypothetical protein
MVRFAADEMVGGWMTLTIVPTAAGKSKNGQDGRDGFDRVGIRHGLRYGLEERGVMSIKGLARDLYKAQQQVHALEKKLESASLLETERLNSELRQARQELAMIRRMLDGQKESAQFMKKFQKFGK